MDRTLMQAYVKKSNEAVPFYQKAFQAELTAAYPNEDGTYMHSELNVYGQVFAVAETDAENPGITGNTMQFCLHFGEGGEECVRQAYDVLKEGAKIHFPLGECSFSRLMTDLTDQYGIRWCIFL